MQCNKQTNRKQHEKGGSFPEEGWRGPCGANEVTCHVSGYGEGGILSFDWKHFPYEDYDDWLWGQAGPWQGQFAGEGDRKPEVLTIQTGLHTCWHVSPQGLYSKELAEVNQTMLDRHLADIPKLMRAVRTAIEANNKKGLSTGTKTVIFLTSGFTGMENSTEIDHCILRVNRMMADAAHANGFAVIERGELERRLMYKSLNAPNPVLINEMHLPQPAQNIIATCLLEMMKCLNDTDMSLPWDPAEVEGHGSGAYNSPLHSPPS
jgi:hypothetical protein